MKTKAPNSPAPPPPASTRGADRPRASDPAPAPARSSPSTTTPSPADQAAQQRLLDARPDKRPVGSAPAEGSVKAGRIQITRETAPATAMPQGGRSFLTKVAIEVGRSVERLKPELSISAAEKRRLNMPERRVDVTVRFQMDDGSAREVPGFRTVFSTVRGPGKGGLRVVPSLDQDTVTALAFEMAPKAAITGAKVGGGKGGFALDPSTLSKPEFARAMRGYVAAVLDATKQAGHGVAFGPGIDVPAPDVGTSPPGLSLMDIAVDEYLGWLAKNGVKEVSGYEVPAALADVKPDATGTATPFVDRYLALFDEGKIPNLALLSTFTGKSVAKGGSLGRTEATGLGVALSTLELLKATGRVAADATKFSGQTVAVQGFGNVGQGAAASFARLGARVTAIAEFDGKPYAILKPAGFAESDVEAMAAYKAEKGTLRGFPGTRELPIDRFWSLDVDVLAPSAREGEITEEVAKQIQAGIVVEGANGPTTHEGDAILAKKGVVVLPDVFANAAGVTVSSYEMEQNEKGERWSLEQVRARLGGDVQAAFGKLHAVVQKRGGTYREAAYDVAVQGLVEELRKSGGADASFQTVVVSGR